MAIELEAEPNRVWGLISDVGGTARWRPDVKKVEMQPAVAGRVRFVETTGQGATPFEVLSQEPPVRQVIRVVDDGLPLGGTWTWDLTPSGTGTRLMISEAGLGLGYAVMPPCRRRVISLPARCSPGSGSGGRSGHRA